MVNGKPNLIFGGGSSVSGTARQRSQGGQDGRTRAAGDFASFLPKAEQGGSARPWAAPTANAPAPAARSLSQPAGQPKAPMHLGMLPDNYIAAGMQNFSTQTTAAANLPTGGNSLAAARVQAAAPAGAVRPVQLAANQPQRLSAKSMPRISGRPITGRNHIGMEDTRKTAAGRSTLTARGGAAHASPAANAAQAQALGYGQQGALTGYASPARAISAPNSNNAYADYSVKNGNLPMEHAGRSFLSVGFSGKNAELALRKLGYDVNEARGINTSARLLAPDPYALNNPQSIPPGAGGRNAMGGADDMARTAILTDSHRRKTDLPQNAYQKKSMVEPFYAMAGDGLGNLAAKFESGSEGIAAIGYDRKGGTSYGKYQIASRVGTMQSFITYLESNAPDLAKRLKAAGPANTGGRGGRMPAEWKKIASEDPARFETLQSDFVRSSHFEPALQGIAASTGVSFEQLPLALREVLFSTAVQHGPSGAVRIVSQALNRVGPQKIQSPRSDAEMKKASKQLIAQIYTLRSGQFGSSTSRVQGAVRNRLKIEMQEALHMLS